MFDSDKFQIRLSSCRKAIKLSQPQLGLMIGVSKQAINDMEHGRCTTSLDKACLLADCFNVSIDYLVGRTDNPEINR